MPFAVTLGKLRELHKKHKQRVLHPTEFPEYAALRDDFSAAMVRALRLTVQPGQSFRQALRVAAAVKLSLNVADRQHATITLDLASRGFAALLGTELPVGTRCTFALLVGAGPIRGSAVVAASKRHGSGSMSFRTSFVIDTLTEADQARLDDLVLEAALAAIGT